MSEKLSNFEKLLSSSLQRTVDFVKFAETKNAALLTFCSGWIVALVSLLTKETGVPPEYKSFMLGVLPLFSVAAMLCIWSFLPQKLERFYNDADGKNLLYFRDIARLGVAEFKSRVRERYIPEGIDDVSEHYTDDLAVQIAVNSAIATRKFTIFNIAGLIVFLSVTILAVPFARHVWNIIVTSMTAKPLL